MYGKAKIPFNVYILISGMLILIFIWSFDNFLLSIPILLYVPLIYRLFFINGNTNILFWGLLLQWLSVAAQVLYCCVIGKPLNELFRNTMFPALLMEYTNYLSITGIYFFTFGIYFAVKKMKINVPENAWDKYDPQKIFQVYIIASVIINLSQAAIWAFPNLVQYFFFFFYIKWGFFLVAFISIFKKAPELKSFLFLVIAIEFALGLSSFFASNFITIVMFSFIAYSAVTRKISYAKGFLFLIIGLLLFHMSVLWTASKTDYRTYLKQGTVSQSVTVSQDKAREKLLELITKVDANTYRLAIEDLVNRVGYVHFFAAAVRMVPSRIPYEGGKIYMEAIGHYLVPRFINPDKPKLDDSKHTNKYTGLGLSGKERATSFSLGSFADAYIDFGPVFMFIPIFLFGYMVGMFFKLLYKPDLWGIILTGPMFLLMTVYATDTTKALGFFFIYFLVFYVLKKSLIKYIDPWMRARVR